MLPFLVFTGLFLTFNGTKDRNMFNDKMRSNCKVHPIVSILMILHNRGICRTNKADSLYLHCFLLQVPLLRSFKSLNPRVVFKKSKLTDLWRKGKITNYQYIMALNLMAGRTFNDITQYPVFPWILADYSSETLDLSDHRVYRDLAKPIGALNPERLAQLINRYQ